MRRPGTTFVRLVEKRGGATTAGNELVLSRFESSETNAPRQIRGGTVLPAVGCISRILRSRRSLRALIHAAVVPSNRLSGDARCHLWVSDIGLARTPDHVLLSRSSNDPFRSR